MKQNRTKNVRANSLNAIYKTAGDPTSGLLNIVNLDTAVQFVERFNNPQKFKRQERVKGADGKRMNAVDDQGQPRMVEVVEISSSQDSGYDSYVSDLGYIRNDTPYTLTPAGLAKITVINLDALHRHALSDDEATATAALQALNAIRQFDGIATTKAKEQLENQAYNRALTIALSNQIPKDAFDEMWKKRGTTIPAAPLASDVEKTENKGRKGKKHQNQTVEETAASEEPVAEVV